MTAPWLSVVMPVYNGGAHLRAAFDSILAQDESDIECLVIDDGSTDESMAIMAEYAERLPIVELRRNRTGNWAANSNAALAAARGRYACFLHQDDRWEPGRLAEIRPLTERHPEVDLFLGPSLFIDPAGRPLGRWTCPLPAYPAMIGRDQILPRLLVQNFVAIPAPVFRTEAALAVGALDESLWYTADWDFWLKLVDGTTIYLPKALSAFRLHGRSQTVLGSRNLADFRRQQDIVLERHLGRLSDRHADRAAVVRAARFSVSVNTMLAAAYHHGTPELWPLAKAAARLGPRGLRRYLRGSRIVERVSARLKARRRAGTAENEGTSRILKGSALQ